MHKSSTPFDPVARSPVARAMPVFICLLALSSATSRANNGDQMLGINAIQWGLSGAVVAAPQEAGTVFANPAGLTLISMDTGRIDAGIGFINPEGSVNGVASEADFFAVPAVAMAKKMDEQISVGLGIGGLAGIGVDIPDALPAPGNQAFYTKKQFLKIAPALAYAHNDFLSLGVALNLDWQTVELRNPLLQLDKESAYGYGAAAGLVYRLPDSAIQLGVAYTTRQHMNRTNWHNTDGTYSARVQVPASLVIGAAWRISHDTHMELDVKKIYFSEVFNVVTFSTPTGPLVSAFGWQDQIVYMIGLQTRVDSQLTLRAGINYGASPIGPEDVNVNIGSMAIPEKHLSLGASYQLNNRSSVSAAFTHAFENRIVSNSGSGNTLEMKQNFLHLQFSYQY